jgi:RNA polymerase primary sigma factor
MGDKIRKMARACNELFTELSREPTAEEIAQRLGWSVEEVLDVEDAMPDATSLNQSMGLHATTSELCDLIEDEHTLDVCEAVMAELERAQLMEVIGRLPEKARHILVRRYGLDDRECATLAELGAELKLSRGRVSRLQREAERMLKVRLSAPSKMQSTDRRVLPPPGASRDSPDNHSCPDDFTRRYHKLDEHRGASRARLPPGRPSHREFEAETLD